MVPIVHAFDARDCVLVQKFQNNLQNYSVENSCARLQYHSRNTSRFRASGVAHLVAEVGLKEEISIDANDLLTND